MANENSSFDDTGGILIGIFAIAFLFLIGLYIYASIFLKEDMRENHKYVVELKKIEFFLQNINKENLEIAKENFEKKENNILNKNLYKDVVEENGEIVNSIIEKFENGKEIVEIEIIVEKSYFDEFMKSNYIQIKDKIDNIAKKNNYYLSDEIEEKNIYFVKGLERWEVSYIKKGSYRAGRFIKDTLYLKKSDIDDILQFYNTLQKKFPKKDYYFNQNGERLIPNNEFVILYQNLGEEFYKNYIQKGIKIKLYYEKTEKS